ncbi:MAG: potassium/proton antiporter [Actinobacteria bacterium]|nr:potassium/proton antiporter [Actinomycetota bacterium]
MVAVALLILLGVVASKISSHLGVPALLLFLFLGMLAGSEGIGGVDFTDLGLAQNVGVIALSFILFAGGFDTQWQEVRSVLGRGILLAILGVLITALIAGAVAAWVLDLSMTAGLLLGAIISSTDAAAVFSVLRSRGIGLKKRLRPLLELESGSNDPMAVFLTLGFLKLLTEPDAGPADLIPIFFLQMAVGGLLGFALARGAIFAINRVRLEYEGLYPVAMIALVLLIYGSASALGGSGFLAVYVAGLVMGHGRFLHKKSLVRFADGLAWLMQIAMFLVLGLLVFPSDVVTVAGSALLVSLVLIFVARPLATALLLLPTGFGVRETAMVSWVGLRGAVPIVLATFPFAAGIPQANLIFNVVFFIVITSVLVQGTTISTVARWLRVDAPLVRRPSYILDAGGTENETADLHELVVDEESAAVGRALVDLRLPEKLIVVLVRREGKFIVPNGSTVLLAGDHVLLLADEATLAGARALITGSRQS